MEVFYFHWVWDCMDVYTCNFRKILLTFSWEVLKTSMKPHPVGVLWTEFLLGGSVLKVLIMKGDMIGSDWPVIVWMKFCNFLLSGGDFLLQQAVMPGVNGLVIGRLEWFSLNRTGKAFWIYFSLTIKVHFNSWLLLTVLSWHKYF